MHVVSDHETIRRWAEARGMQPCRVDGDDAAAQHVSVVIRLHPAEAAKPPSLRDVSWNEWFLAFDSADLVLMIEEAARQPSAIYRIVPRAGAVTPSLSADELVG